MIKDKKVKRHYRHHWTDQEDQLLKKLLLHFGEDFQKISNTMNHILFYDEMTQNKVKVRWVEQRNPSINRDQLSEDEGYKLYQLFLKYVHKSKDSLWVRLSKLFPDRPSNILRQRFLSLITSLMRRLNVLFGSLSQQKHYHYRITLLSQITISIILSLAFYEPSQYDLVDPVFMKIVYACKKLQEMVDFFFEKKITHSEDIKYYFDQKIFNSLPRLSEHEFSDIIEPILVLEQLIYFVQLKISTLNKICFATQPYNYGVQKRKRAKLDPKTKMRIEESDDEIEKGSPTRFRHKLEPHKHRYVKLNSQEVKLILNSETVQKLLPIQMKIQQQKKS